MRGVNSEHPMLIRDEIIYEEFQPMWSRYPSVIDGQTNGRTHGEIAMAIQRSA